MILDAPRGGAAPSPAPAPPGLPPRWRRAGFALAALAAFAAFWPDLGGRLLAWDDLGYVVDNELVRTLSARTAIRAFTEFCCNYWAPLTWLSLAVDHAAWGLDPFGYHLTNNLLHALNAGLLFLVGVRLLARAGPAAPPPPARLLAGAMLAALFWGLHPLRVESVAWVAERKDVLSTCFGLLATLAWLRHAEDGAAGPRPWWGFLRRPAYLAALGLYALSLLSKPGLVTLPLALLALDWHPLGRLGAGRRGEALAEKAPLLALALGAALVTMRATAPTLHSLAVVDLGTRVLVAFSALATYLRLTVAPLDVSPIYLHPVRLGLSAPVVLSVAVVLALGAAAAWQARRRPALLAGALFFLVTLLPYLGLVLNGPQALAPRFTYVPGMALAVLLGAALAPALVRPSGAASRPALAAVAVALAALAAVTVRDIGHWRDDVALWTRIIELDDDRGAPPRERFLSPYKERAIALTEEERYEEALADLDRAVAVAERQRHGSLHQVLALRAGLLWTLGRNAEAAADLRKAAASVGEPLRSAYRRQLPLLLGPAGADPAAAPAGGPSR